MTERLHRSILACRPSITSIHLAQIDCGSEVFANGISLVGASLFQSVVLKGRVTFSVRSALLQPTDAPEVLRHWLDEHLHDQGSVVFGYDLCRPMGALHHADTQTVSHRTRRMLMSATTRPVVDLKLVADDAHSHLFEACEALGIPTDPRGSLDRFDDWCLGRRARSLLGMQIDAIATWRLALASLGTQSLAGECLRDGMSINLRRWLHDTDAPAGRPHLASLNAMVGGRCARAGVRLKP